MGKEDGEPRLTKIRRIKSMGEIMCSNGPCRRLYSVSYYKSRWPVEATTISVSLQ